MSKGYVYVLSNEAMPGVVKIGKTSRRVEQRAKELHTSGVPRPFTVEFQILSPDCGELEKMAHLCMSALRVDNDREFFEISAADARACLEELLDEQVENWLDEIRPGCGCIEHEYMLDSSVVFTLADRLNVEPDLVVDAVHDLRPEEIRSSLVRAKARRAGLGVAK